MIPDADSCRHWAVEESGTAGVPVLDPVVSSSHFSCETVDVLVDGCAEMKRMNPVMKLRQTSNLEWTREAQLPVDCTAAGVDLPRGRRKGTRMTRDGGARLDTALLLRNGRRGGSGGVVRAPRTVFRKQPHNAFTILDEEAPRRGYPRETLCNVRACSEGTTLPRTCAAWRCSPP